LSTTILDPDIPVGKIVQIIRSGSPEALGVTRMRALVALGRSRSTRKAEVFSSLFANPQELPRFRNLAIAGLLELGGVAAERALLQCVPNADEFTAAALALALGRVGSPDVAPAIGRLQGRAPPAHRRRAEFAMSLLAYRHNLPGGEVAVPTGRALLKIGPKMRAQPMAVVPASPADIDSVARTLKREPIGIKVTYEGARRIQCGPSSFVLLLNSAFAGPGVVALRKRKGIAGVLFRKHPIEDSHSLSSFVLVTPGSPKLQVSVHKPHGVPRYAGQVTVENDGSATFAVRAVRQPGTAAVEFSGSFAAGKLSVETARCVIETLAAKAPRADARS
jgi:hypothetical protein